MMSALCDAIRPSLGPFVDRELRGVEMLEVAAHLETCGACREEVATWRRMGEQLRQSSGRVADHPSLDGLAAGVVARTRAEQAQSWRATWERAVDDWHWVIVGAGSIAATFVSTLLVSAVLWFGPAPNRHDSLAAVLNERGARPVVFVVWTGAEAQREGMLLGVADGGQVPSLRVGQVARATFLGVTERELVEALADLVTHRGRLVRLESMSEDDRLYAEALLDEITRIRRSTSEVLLMTSTTVSAKGL